MWTVVQQWFVCLWYPGGTVLASEGHLILGEGVLEETGWRSPAESDPVLTHTSSVIPLFLLFSAVLCCFRLVCSLFLSSSSSSLALCCISSVATLSLLFGVLLHSTFLLLVSSNSSCLTDDAEVMLLMAPLCGCSN